MTEGERVKAVRKERGLTLEKFGECFGMSRSSISDIENGRRSLTIQTRLSICREFNVSETWLRTGEGEMFVPTPDGALDAFIRERKLSQSDRILIEKFAALDAEGRQKVVEYVLSVADEIMKNHIPAADAKTDIPVPAAVPDIAAELAELKRQNQELAAEIAAMKEEDALLGLTDGFSISPTESAGSLSQRAKK